MSYPKPTVRKIPGTQHLWGVTITWGFSGNYEHESAVFLNWRDAFDWAYEQVKDWEPGLRR